MRVFTYSWHLRETHAGSRIVAYGIAESGDNVQLSFPFRPRCYVALPRSVEWTDDKLAQLSASIRGKLLTDGRQCFLRAPQLYGGGGATHPFLRCSFKTRGLMRASENACRDVFVQFLGGRVSLTFHETEIHPIVQAVTSRFTDFTGWQSIPDASVQSRGQRTFDCVECELELDGLDAGDPALPPEPLVMSFDLETYSSDRLKFPNAQVAEDCIFQISCVFHRGASAIETILLCMLECDPIEGVEVRVFANEYTLIKGFVALVTLKNPHILCGYNIMKFDLPYLIQRATLHRCLEEFQILGFPKFVAGVVTEKKWSSAAYRDQEYKFLDIEGRIYVDLNPFVEKNFKLENYKLSTVAREFLADDKVDMDVRTMFKSFEMAFKGRPGAAAAMAEVGRYCVHDSVLVARLFEKLQVWPSLVEMSRVVHCPVADILLRGQEIRVFNSIVKFCYRKMVIVKPPTKPAKKSADDKNDEDRYAGAYVFEPVPGMYENVVPFDFASLYPSTIIAYNIDYSTLVTDDSPPVADDACHVFQWEDHIGCEHDARVIRLAASDDRAEKADIKKKLPKHVICAARKFRFLKSPEGVLPSIIRNCLNARRETRRQLALVDKSSADWQILNQRQLAYKISANSIYGFTGIGSKGKLSLLPLAMCITNRGRENVKRAADEMSRRFGAIVLYGDTDSNYVTFPATRSASQVWDLAVRAAAEISALFPQPMELEFEETIYSQFLILAKKKYVFRKMNRDGRVDSELGKIGVVLNRRDNCKFIRDVYALLVDLVFDNSATGADARGCRRDADTVSQCLCKNCILLKMFERIYELETRRVAVSQLVVTKGCRDYGADDDSPVDDRLGSYKIRPLPQEPEAKMRKLGDRSEAEFYASQLPAVAQLKKRMTRRGLPVTEGSRVEYVMVRYGGVKQGENIEDVDYFAEFSHILQIDTLYYMNLLVAPLDQILETCFGMRDVIKRHAQLRMQKRRVDQSVLKLFSCRWPNDSLAVKRKSIAVGRVRLRVWDICVASVKNAGRGSDDRVV